MEHHYAASPAETVALGEAFGRRLSGGEVLLLDGDLGAGKTAFVSGVAKALGIASRVTSPTFTIVNRYTTGRVPLTHFDLYRIADPEELFELGWEEYLSDGGVVAVEWFRNAGEELPENYILITLRYQDEGRSITIQSIPPEGETAL
ncbi:MAG: tRNA (adenosine(37)-N6)-threonylcarbamoyltransferase complex ATPase subunit type 1 TsaE [Clostridia bacterium]|nr:tRNA (adenosine(37)-N6)-threonylcarbamoyltransferase complex ATPase subunit type 1 TsaE [Clostridia bacterium]